MARKKRGLGKGLNELWAAMGADLEVDVTEELNATPSKTAKNTAGAQREQTLEYLPVAQIKGGPFQPRQSIDNASIEQLAESIRAQGVLQPIVVRKKQKGSYEIVAGERRWRAAQLAGLAEIPSIVKDISEATALAVALIENIQREDLSPIEEARALKRLVDALGGTHLQLAEAVGKSRASVTNLLRLLALPLEVQRLLETKQIEMGHARALLSLSKKQQQQIASVIIARGLSVRETESLVGGLQNKKTKKHASPKIDPNIRRLQGELADKLGAPVFIKHSAKKGQGQLVIRYNDLDELEGILMHFQ